MRKFDQRIFGGIDQGPWVGGDVERQRILGNRQIFVFIRAYFHFQLFDLVQQEALVVSGKSLERGLIRFQKRFILQIFGSGQQRDVITFAGFQFRQPGYEFPQQGFVFDDLIVHVLLLYFLHWVSAAAFSSSVN